MRRSTSVLLIVALSCLLSASFADAKGKPRRVTRVATAPYDTPAPGLSSGPWAGNCGSPSTGCGTFATSSKEKYATFSISDSTGQSASGAVWEGSGTELVLIAQFCGETTESIQIPAGQSIIVTAHAGPSPSNICPGVATSGTIEATFSNLP